MPAHPRLIRANRYLPRLTVLALLAGAVVAAPMSGGGAARAQDGAQPEPLALDSFGPGYTRSHATVRRVRTVGAAAVDARSVAPSPAAAGVEDSLLTSPLDLTPHAGWRRPDSAVAQRAGGAPAAIEDGIRIRSAGRTARRQADAASALDSPAIGPTIQAFRRADTGWNPASPDIAVGGGYVVGAANAHFNVWRVDGTAALQEPIALDSWYKEFLDTMAADLGLPMYVTDPHVARDPTTGRFILAAAGWPQDSEQHLPVVFFSVSDTPDPTKSWCSRVLGVGHNEDGTNNAVWERLSMATTRRGVVLLSNLIAHKGHHEFAFAAARVHTLSAETLFAPGCVNVDVDERDLITDANDNVYNRAILAQASPPGDVAIAVGSWSFGAESIRLWPIGLAADGTIDDVLQADVAVDDVSSPVDASQRGTAQLLYTGGAEITSAAVQGARLWAAQTIDEEGRAAIGWYRVDVLRPSDVEQGRFTLGPDEDASWPAIVPSPSCDNAYVVCNISGSTTSPSIVLTDIRGDSFTRVVEGTGCQGDASREVASWGYRTGAVVDPATGRVWGHAAFGGGRDADCTRNGWETQVFSAAWDICGPVGPTPSPTATPAPSGGTKGIGFALASKRYMRGVYGFGGLTARRGGMSGSANTGLQVQNIDGVRTALPSVEFVEQRLPYSASGADPFHRTVDMRTIPPGASLNAYLPSLDLRDAMYRVTIATPRDGGDLSAILRTDWDTGGAAIVSNLYFTPRTIIPNVVRASRGHTSVIALTNAESAPASVALRFFRAGSGNEVATKRLTIPGVEALTFDLNDNDDVFRTLGEGFRGTAIVDAPNGRVGAQVYEYVESSALAVGGFEGIPSSLASRRLFVPLFRSQQSGPGGIRLNTQIAVANAGDADASVTVSYRPTTNTSASNACRSAGVVRHGPVRIPPSSSFVFDQGPGGGSGLPEDCFGSAVIETANSGDRVAATILDIQNSDETLSMIDASPIELAATKVALPLFRSRHLVAAFTTGIQVMNTSDRAANVHIDFSRSEGTETFPIGGCQGQCDAIIRPYEAYTWWPPAVNAIPPGTYGAAVLSSDQPIVVLVNDYPLNGNSDMATYAGIAVLSQ